MKRNINKAEEMSPAYARTSDNAHIETNEKIAE